MQKIMTYSRILSLMLLIIMGAPMDVYAQRESVERNIFNTITGSSGNGPISIKQLLLGKKGTDESVINNFFGGQDNRPDGLDNNFSLGLSPDQVTASRARRDALAQQQELEALNAIKEASEETDFLEQASLAARNASLGGPRQSTLQSTTPQRRIYNKRERGFEKPRKVFNSIY